MNTQDNQNRNSDAYTRSLNTLHDPRAKEISASVQNHLFRCREPIKIGGYSLNQYSEEDHRMYGEYLESIPYVEELDKGFIKIHEEEVESNEPWVENVVGSITLEMEYLFSPVPPHDEDEERIKETKIDLLHRFLEEELTATEERRAFMYFSSGLSLEEIAEYESASVHSIWVSINRVLKKLRRRFREAGYEITEKR